MVVMIFTRLRLPLFLPVFALCSAANAGADSAKSASTDYQPNPAIWKLADEDTEIYMLGTIHALSPEIRWRSPALNGIIAQVDELVLETVEPEKSGDAKNDDMDEAMMAAMLSGINRKPLIDRVDPKNRETLKQVAKQFDLPMDYLDLVPTWMVAFVLFYQSADEDGVSPDHGVETVLEGVFRTAKKPISAIEDAKAVDAALNALSEAEQLVALNEMLSEIRTSSPTSLLPDAEQSVDAAKFADDIEWAQGDIRKIGDDMTPESMGDAYYRALLVNRNAAWTQWLAERLQKPGKVLLAVGAAHLAGKDSVQTMLQKRGLTVERVR